MKTNKSAGALLDRPLRVLCCSGSLQGGGSERRLWQLASRLDRELFEPTVYLLYNSGTYRDRLPSDVIVEAYWDHFDQSARRWPGQIHRSQIAHMSEVIRQRRIDIVFDQTFHMTLIADPSARRTGIPRVSVIVSPPSSDFQRSRERFKFLKKRLLSAAYRRPGCLTLAVSEDTAADAASFYRLPPSLIQPVPSPIDMDAVRMAAAEYHVAARGTNQLRIVVVGRLSNEKGQLLALESLRLANANRNNTYVLDIIGDGPDRSQLQQSARQLGIEHCVSFHGFLENPYPFISAADILCIPSHYEGLPNVALEAMALGTHVVATNCSGALRKLIGNNERGWLVPNGDADRMSSAYLDLTTNPTKWSARRDAAKCWVEKHHAFSPWLDKMQLILKNAALWQR